MLNCGENSYSLNKWNRWSQAIKKHCVFYSGFIGSLNIFNFWQTDIINHKPLNDIGIYVLRCDNLSPIWGIFISVSKCKVHSICKWELGACSSYIQQVFLFSLLAALMWKWSSHKTYNHAKGSCLKIAVAVWHQWGTSSVLIISFHQFEGLQIRYWVSITFM